MVQKKNPILIQGFINLFYKLSNFILNQQLSIDMGIKGFGIGVGSNYKQENIYQLNTIKDLLSYI